MAKNTLTPRRLFTLTLVPILVYFIHTNYRRVGPPHHKSIRPPQPPPSSFETRFRADGRRIPSCARDGRARSFLIVFMGHSGSTAVLSELRSHEQTFINKSEPVDHQREFDSKAALRTARDHFRKGIALGKTPGFKIRPTHILHAPQQWHQLVREFDTRIVWQYRRNLMKGGVAEYSHRYLNDFTVVEGLKQNISREERCEMGAGCRFKIDNFDNLNKLLLSTLRSHRKIVSAVHAVDGGRNCVFELPYEDYLYNRVQTVQRLQTFLGFKVLDTQPQRFKATSDVLCDVVENWNGLCQAFYPCLLWQSMLEDAHNNCYCDHSPIESPYCAYAG